jgi:sortase A
MKVLVKHALLKPLLAWAQRGLFAGAIASLGYCAFVRFDTWTFQRQQSEALEGLLREASDAKNAPVAAASTSASAAARLAGLAREIGPAGLLGRIEIPRLGVSVVVVEGTGDVTLRRAAGHIDGTGLPGQIGNVGIAAHRDTFFRPLQNIQNDDLITLATSRGEYRYRVVSTKVVSPDDVGVLDPDGNEILTLVTCYPFNFVGAAPDRFIVRAARVI